MPHLGRKTDTGQTMLSEAPIDYPTIYLYAEQVAAMGLWPFDVGEGTMMHAKVRVSAKSQDAGEERQMTLELIDATVDAKKGIDADRMYPTTVAAMPAGRMTK